MHLFRILTEFTILAHLKFFPSCSPKALSVAAGKKLFWVVSCYDLVRLQQVVVEKALFLGWSGSENMAAFIASPRY